VKRQERRVVGEQLVDVEQETMQCVFQNCPYEVAKEKEGKSFGEGVECDG
jgi:hypothetical protein